MVHNYTTQMNTNVLKFLKNSGYKTSVITSPEVYRLYKRHSFPVKLVELQYVSKKENYNTYAVREWIDYLQKDVKLCDKKLDELWNKIIA